MPTLPLNEARDALEKWGDQLMGILKAGSLKNDVTLISRQRQSRPERIGPPLE